MGSSCSNKMLTSKVLVDKAAVQNARINDYLADEQTKKPTTILLLGAGEVGKSTFLRQLDNKGLNKRRKEYVEALRQNTRQSMAILIRQAEAYQYVFSAEENALKQAIDAADGDSMSLGLANQIHELWASPAIQSTYARRSEFYLLDNCAYTMEHCVRFADETKLPTEEDIVLARQRTTGILHVTLNSDGQSFHMVDVGGQRSERRKWISCFADVDAIAFFVDAASWNRVLFEDEEINSMAESLDLFEKTLSRPIFAQTPIFLLFNKLDLFRSDLSKSDAITKLRQVFPDYNGLLDEQTVLEYMAKQFQARLPSTHSRAMIHGLVAKSRDEAKSAFQFMAARLVSKSPAFKSPTIEAQESLTTQHPFAA